MIIELLTRYVKTLILFAAWKIYEMAWRFLKKSMLELDAQKEARLTLEKLKNDIRASAWHDHLIGPKFIIQDPFDSGNKELGGTRLKFAKFVGVGQDGKPVIEKIMYAWDRSKGQLLRGNWEGPWTDDNASPILNPHKVAQITAGKGEGYIFFKDFSTDVDEKYGLVGRTFIFVGIKIDHGEGQPIEVSTIVGSRFINTRDREPFWNQNQNAVTLLEVFEK